MLKQLGVWEKARAILPAEVWYAGWVIPCFSFLYAGTEDLPSTSYVTFLTLTSITDYAANR